jgi:hypothetical protein
MLSATRTNLTTWRTEGQIWISGDQLRRVIESVAVNGGTAVVMSCEVANDVLVAVGTDDVRFPTPDAVRNRTTMVNQGGAWLVQYVDVLGHWEDINTCPP